MPELPIDTPEVDIAVVGAGAAGLMAAIWAGRTRPGLRIAALDGALKLGAKVLVAGGGRCNVTHDAVDPSAYAGSSRHAIRNVIRRFDVPRTVEFFRELGVELKREETGKLFPTTDDARTVLEALLRAARDTGVQLIHPWRVESIAKSDDGFLLAPSPAHPPTPSPAHLIARRIILATGGRSLPKSGSDGHGYDLVRALGHTVTRTWPALVPLTLPKDHWLCALSGLSAPATLELRSPTGKRLVSFTDSTLCTHFGLSGPGVLDISRYYTDATASRSSTPSRGTGVPPVPTPPTPLLLINWLPSESADSLDAALAALKNTALLRFLSDRLPDRLARALCGSAGVDPSTPGHQLTRERRRALARAVCETPLPVTGDRGWNYAEVTAGGVPLAELHLDTMESRLCPGLHLCGEICDVDGRIGGYNFQWAWASGFVAGIAAATPVTSRP
ncbi:MAG: NAD(P)/FAD-dependent oxidoreductase [Phycisphaerales bacterium]